MSTPTPETHPELYIKETRTLRDGRGQDRLVTMGKIYWDSFEFMINETHLIESDLLAIGEEEAGLRNITFDEYFAQGLVCMVHYFLDRPELLLKNRNNGQLAGYIGPVSKLQIKELDQQLNDTD